MSREDTATNDGDDEVENGPASPLVLGGNEEHESRSGMTRSQAFNLYTSHFLSTWNVRTYEFAAVSTLNESGEMHGC